MYTWFPDNHMLPVIVVNGRLVPANYHLEDPRVSEKMAAMTKHKMELSLQDEKKCESQALLLLKVIRPRWVSEEVVFKVFTTGITNKIFSVSSQKETLVFRVFGQNTEQIIDRDHELRSWALLASQGLAAELIAKFDNGLVCGYLEGDSLTRDSVRLPDIKKEICRSIARMHSIPPCRMTASEPCLFDKLNSFTKNFNGKFAEAEKQARYEEYFNFSIQKQVDEMAALIVPHDDKVVFCHNDLLIHNILYNKATGTISFIDYEYADYNYALFDIANHFNEYAGVDGADYSFCPSTAEKKAFLYDYEKMSVGHVDGDKLDKMCQRIPLFEAASHLFWAAWALVQSQNSTIDFDYLGYAILRHEQYAKRLTKYKGQ